jgi:hypothetical protein
VFDLAGARCMLPLIKRILADVVAEHASLVRDERAAQQAAGEGDSWEGKRAAFRLADAATAHKRTLEGLVAESRKLGVEILDGATGLAAFPTIVNGALAYLVLRHEDDDVYAWRYRDQPKLRPIPRSWFGQPPVHESEPEGMLL